MEDMRSMGLKSALCLLAFGLSLSCFAEPTPKQLYFINREDNGAVDITTCTTDDCYRVAVAPKEQVDAACGAEKSAIAGKTITDVAGVLLAGYVAPIIVQAGGEETLSVYNGPIRGLAFKQLGKYLAKIKATKAMNYLVGTPEFIVVKGGKIALLRWISTLKNPVGRAVHSVETQVAESYSPASDYNLTKVLCGDAVDHTVTAKISPDKVSRAVENADPEKMRAFKDALSQTAPGY